MLELKRSAPLNRYEFWKTKKRETPPSECASTHERLSGYWARTCCVKWVCQRHAAWLWSDEQHASTPPTP